MSDAPRARKLAGRIHQIVASMLRSQVKDPRLGMVTVTDVRLTPDLRDATVYYTVFGDEQEQAATAAALHSATGILRSQVGRQTGVKFTPTLSFVADTVPDTARHIDDLLARAQAEDARLHRVRVGASYAGDADPYRASDDPGESDGQAAPRGSERSSWDSDRDAAGEAENRS